MAPEFHVDRRLTTDSRACPFAPLHSFVTITAFTDDLRAVARRLGYPFDDEAASMLTAAVHCTQEQWDDAAQRELTMARLRKIALHAVLKAVNAGSRYVDGRTMALALIDNGFFSV